MAKIAAVASATRAASKRPLLPGEDWLLEIVDSAIGVTFHSHPTELQ